MACQAVMVTLEKMWVNLILGHDNLSSLLDNPCLSPQGPIGVPGLMGEPGLFGTKVITIIAHALKLITTQHGWE